MQLMPYEPLQGGRVALALAPALQAMLPALAGRSAVLLPDLPALRGGGRRRLAEALLEDAARTGGGNLYRTGSGQTLLFGTAPGAAARAAASLAGLLRQRATT